MIIKLRFPNLLLLGGWGGGGGGFTPLLRMQVGTGLFCGLLHYMLKVAHGGQENYHLNFPSRFIPKKPSLIQCWPGQLLHPELSGKGKAKKNIKRNLL